MKVIPNDTAVLFIDMINHFNFHGGGKLRHYTEKMLPNLLKLKDFAYKHQLPVIYVNDHYNLWTSDYQTIFNYCLNEKSESIITAIKPDKNDYFFIKPQHSAFFQTPLKSLLNDLGKTHVIISGIAGDICVLFTAKDAYMYQFTMSIPKNCIASEEIEGNDYTLYLLNTVMKANITPI